MEKYPNQDKTELFLYILESENASKKLIKMFKKKQMMQP